MKNLTKFLFAALAFGVVMVSCEPNDGGDSETGDLILSTVDNKTTITGDGVDAVEFVVMRGNTNVSEVSQIQVDGVDHEGLSFTSSEGGLKL